ncbi:MAG: 50S ribosomal protein L5 [Planctomycetota bacterium]|nr:50S ribosomal protein L5 [Planctomycetota bacterium]MDI6786908.1 50S ribosomal protein L5 [Planctomycetota bacterium]
MNRLLEKYQKEVLPLLIKEVPHQNRMAVPKLEKIVVSMGVGKVTEEKERLESVAKDLSLITGQKPILTRARQSVAGFKLRKGELIGCKVTLRRHRMYCFLDKLIGIVIPRQRDFRGYPRKSFDQQGNYNLGVTEQSLFPEISIDHIKYVQGMDITLVLKSPSVELSYKMLKALGFPFRD